MMSWPGPGYIPKPGWRLVEVYGINHLVRPTGACESCGGRHE